MRNLIKLVLITVIVITTLSAFAQNIGNSKSEILDKLDGKIEIKKKQSGEEQITFNEERTSKIIGKYQRATIYTIGLNKKCINILVFDPVSEYKFWCDYLDSKYERVSSNEWKDNSSNTKIYTRTKEDTVLMIFFTEIALN